MSADRGDMPEEEIIEKILSDGRAQAERMIASAKRSVEAERRKAESEAEKVRGEILGRVKRKAENLKSKEIASAQIESKRILLRAREQAISKAFTKIEEELSNVRANPTGYRKALANLAAEAVTAIGQPEVRLKLHPDDAPMADETFLSELRQRTEDMTGNEVQALVEADPAISGGGCTALSQDGRIVFDNTFGRRLERMKTGLRSEIVREVLKIDV
jgi:vacuolar-type H+-ATPase subunit E/Vma4